MEGLACITEKHLQNVETLIVKEGLNSAQDKIMLCGVRAWLNSQNINAIQEFLYEKLNQSSVLSPTQQLETHIRLTEQLNTLKAPVEAENASYVLVGMDILKFADEFLQENDNDLLNFLKFFSKFGLCAVEIAEDKIFEQRLPVMQNIINTMPHKALFSEKYEYLMSCFKPLSYLMLLNEKMTRCIADLHNIKSNTEKFRIIKETQEFVNSITIDELMNALPDPLVLDKHYKQFLNLKRELQNNFFNIKETCKIEIIQTISSEMQSGVLNLIFDEKYTHRFKAISIQSNEVKNVFKGILSSELYTKPKLSKLRQRFEELFGKNIDDKTIAAVYMECRKIHKEITQAKSFETRYSNMTQSQFAAAAA